MRFLNHPLHPALVHFPVAFLTGASLCDGLALAGWALAWPVGSTLLAAGLVAGVLAMAAGVADWLALHDDDAAHKTAQRHIVLVGLAWIVYLWAGLARFQGGALITAAAPNNTLPSFAGLVLLIAGAWHGGHLVYIHGAGVRRR